jgi:hypothetical protein
MVCSMPDLLDHWIVLRQLVVSIEGEEKDYCDIEEYIWLVSHL